MLVFKQLVTFFKACCSIARNVTDEETSFNRIYSFLVRPSKGRPYGKYETMLSLDKYASIFEQGGTDEEENVYGGAPP